MKHFDDIKDDEIRIISRQEVKHRPLYRRWWFWASLTVALAILVAVVLMLLRKLPKTDDIAHELTLSEPEAVSPTIVRAEPATVIIRDTVINDVLLRLYQPLNAVPELCIGYPDVRDTSIVMAFQAADIRADNHEILGAFVLRGELLSRGRSKKGFCTIIDGKIQLGMSESTPLLEEATEKEGYFFRQYPLVMEGKMVENKPKGKAVRRALCEYDGSIMTVSSMEKESFHDFAQALADMGVKNAIYLIGSESYGFCRTTSNEKHSPIVWGQAKSDETFKNVNFILWRAVE